MATPEGKVKKRLNKRLSDLFGNKVYRFMPVQTGYGSPGLDYFLCVNGYFIAVETKANDNRPTPRQLTTMAHIREAGGLTFVVNNDESMEYLMYHLQQLLKPHLKGY